MKKWILIGILVLAVSAIAASRIRNNGITLDDYFAVNATHFFYNGRNVTFANLNSNYDTGTAKIFFDLNYTDDPWMTNGLIRLIQDTSTGQKDIAYIEPANIELMRFAPGEWGNTWKYSECALRPYEIACSNYTDYLMMKNALFMVNSSVIKFPRLSGTGNGFACLDSDGKLYRSATACA